MQIKNVRFIIAAITTFSAYAVYVSRVNLSIAIIAMVDDHHGNNTTGPHESPKQSSINLNSSESLTSDAVLVASIKSSINPGDHNQQVFSSTNTTNNGNILPAALVSDGSTASSRSSPLTNIFMNSKNSLKTPLISQEKFHWDQTEQGHILGAFFYGYILFQIPGARMAESVGARWIIMAASAGSAIISLVFPLSTQLNSIHLLMVLRFVMGLCQSAFFPAAYCLFCRWLPEKERSILIPIMFIGSNMGSISTYIMSSYLISSSYGWPSVFYLSGWICLLCSILWFVFGSNGPEDNWWISKEEQRLIERDSEDGSVDLDDSSFIVKDESRQDMREKGRKSIELEIRASVFKNDRYKIEEDNSSDHSYAQKNGDQIESRRAEGLDGKKDKANQPQGPSWSKMFKSVPIWTLILSMYGNEWSNVVLCYELPTYLNTALNFPIEQNGVINSFFQLSYAIASPIMSSLGAYMLDKHLFGMRKLQVRKLFQSLATFGQLACFVSVPICGPNRGLIIMFMFLAIVFKACANAGDIMVSGDLSPEYAGTIFAFANSIGNTAGFFVPLLAAAFVDDPYQRIQWTPFWLTTAAIMCFSGVIFLILGETRKQDFSKESEFDLTKE